MNTSLHDWPAGDSSGTLSPWYLPGPRELARRSRLLWRLRFLLLIALVAFTATTWLLVRPDGPLRLLPQHSGPAAIVKRHLAALNRGQLRDAYELFSPEYRRQVTFEMYHSLVVSHWVMFRTSDVSYERTESAADRSVMETHMRGADGEAYRARFTLVHRGGRWWIDDLRWGSAPDDSHRIRI